MVDTAHFPSSYRDISWRQAWNLKTTSDQLLNSGDAKNPAFQQDVKNWYNVVTRLEASILNRPSIFRLIWELVTLQLFKKLLLWKNLPYLYTQTDLKVNEVVKHLWRTKKPTSPLETLKKARDYFAAHHDRLLSSHANPLIDNTIIYAQVIDYFKNKIEHAEHCATLVTLPRWMHATYRANAGTDIINSGILQQHKAPAGTGVFFSTQHETSYGPICLAIDEGMIEKLPASYFPGLTRPKNPNPPIWIRVEQNVPVEWESVAHIVCATPQDEENFLDHLTQNELSDQAAIVASCPRIYQPTHNILMECFNSSSTKPILSPDWKRHSWCHVTGPSYSLPQGAQAQEASALLLG